MPPTVALDLTPLTTGSRLRGIGRAVSELAAAIAALPPEERAGLEVTGLVRDLPWTGGPWFDPTLRFAGGEPPLDGPVGRRVRDVVRRFSLYRRLRAAGVALLHATEPCGRPPPEGFPYVVTCYDLIPIVRADIYRSPVPFSAARRLRLARGWYERARRIVAISEATREDLVQWLRIDRSKIDVVLLGVDHARFHTRAEPGEEAKVRAALGTARPFLLYVGAADPRKNLPFLIEAYARSGVAAEADLVIAGHMAGWIRATLVAAARQSGVGDRVLLPGYVPDAIVPAMYRTCLGHTFASTYEGFGLPVAEAMACGAPTLTSFLTSLREIAGDAALELPTADLDGAADAVRRLVGDEALRDDLRRRGPLQARRFTWDACARGVLASWRRALAD